jgi:DNA-binding NarL/FixJ family response regulator
MSEEPVIRVIVIDDQEMVLQTVVRLLSVDPQIVVVGEALNARQGIEATHQEQPNIVVLDYTLPDMDHPNALEKLHEVCPDVKIITLSGWERPATFAVSMRAGSSAWVTKTRAIQELRDTVLRVAAGLPVTNEDME